MSTSSRPSLHGRCATHDRPPGRIPRSRPRAPARLEAGGAHRARLAGAGRSRLLAQGALRAAIAAMVLGLSARSEAAGAMDAVDRAAERALASTPAERPRALEALARGVSALPIGEQEALRLGHGATADSWRRVVLAGAAVARLRDPALASSLGAVRGLDPAVYLERRRPAPEATRELLRRGEALVPILQELALLGAREREATRRPRDAYPAGLTDAQLAELERAEDRALLHGALHAIARAPHPTGRFLLESIARDPARELATRQVAVRALGIRGGDGALALLTELARDPSAAAPLREVACEALGARRTPAAVAALAALLGTGDPAIIRAVVAAIGAAGSRSVELSAARAEPGVRGEAQRLLVALVADPGPVPEVTLLEALGASADRALAHALEGLARSSRGADPEVEARVRRARARVERSARRFD